MNTLTNPAPTIDPDLAHEAADDVQPSPTQAAGRSTAIVRTQADGSGSTTLPPTDLAGDWDDDSPLPPRRPKLLTPASWALVALLIGGGGFVLGAREGRNTAPRAPAAPARTGTAGAARANGNATGGTASAAAGVGANGTAGVSGGGGGGGGGATVGQVQLVDGSNVYVLNSAGNVVKVTVGTTATVTVNKPGTPADFKPGDTVVVQGATDADGNIAATSIAAGTGGFGRGGGVGGGGGAAPTATGAARPSSSPITGG